MKTQVLAGRFLKTDGTPYEGEVMFIPVDLWEVEEGITWAKRAPRVPLVDGRFEVEVSVGEYRVYTPIGRWVINVKATDRIGYLSDHLQSRLK